jgi:hypothetical protein
VILIALTLLLVGMARLYARRPAAGAARVIEYGGAYQEEGARLEQAVTERERHERAGGHTEMPAPRSRRAGALVPGTGLVTFFLMRQ